jgi:hypothetical protein
MSRIELRDIDLRVIEEFIAANPETRSTSPPIS